MFVFIHTNIHVHTSAHLNTKVMLRTNSLTGISVVNGLKKPDFKWKLKSYLVAKTSVRCSFNISDGLKV